ncbi:MAG: hypothetical protein EYC68_02180 [Chloroflexota bacterium]|nr:MAG: hypothetical protein EYC68_02180 [Chloroflexota bacterium]
MDTSDFVELGAGLALGGMMSRAIGNAFTNALDAHTSIKVIAVPQTRAEIQMLLDKLDVQLANGKMSEATYKTLTAKWEKRLNEISS